MCLLSPFSHFWLCSLTGCSPPGSSVHGILKTRTLEWVAASSPGRLLYHWHPASTPRESVFGFADLVSHAQFPALSSPKPFLPTAWVQTLSQADLQLVHVGATRNPFPLSGCPFLLVSVYRAFAYASLVAQTIKASAYNTGDHVQSLDWEDPWRRKWQPTPIFLPGDSHGQRSLAGYSPWGPRESDTTERLHSLTHCTC